MHVYNSYIHFFKYCHQRSYSETLVIWTLTIGYSNQLQFKEKK